MSEQVIKAQELADHLGGTLRDCPPDHHLTEVMTLEEGGPCSVSFLANPKYLAQARESKAGLILVGPKDGLEGKPRLVMEDPYLGFAKAVALLHPEPDAQWGGAPIHASAQIAPGARIAPGVSIGARSVIGPRCVLHPGVHIGEDCVLGEECVLFSGVVLYRKSLLGNRVRLHGNCVIGADGFGYATSGGRHHKIIQAGWVELGDDVELGACVTVDRAALGATRVKAGTKVDNLCHIAHGVQIGEHCLIISQCAIGGSTSLGDHVTLAGKVGTAGHIHIGSRSVVSGNSMVAKDLAEGSFVSGYLARPHRQWMECQAALNRLPGILKRLGKGSDKS